MIESISYLDVLKRGLRVMDATAISLCQENSLPIVIFNLNVHGNIKRVSRAKKWDRWLRRSTEQSVLSIQPQNIAADFH